MAVTKLYKILLNNFPLAPTQDQDNALKQLSEFIFNNDDILLIKGYAGTGKTTLINTLVKSLKSYEKKAVLLAPTGRAAKVITSYTKKEASTIHRYIYKPRTTNGSIKFVLNPNKSKNTIYIVDEASMISNINDRSEQFEGTLLDDLIQFVQQGKNCKLIFIGDIAQLPPVRSNTSPALDETTLIMNYAKRVNINELKEVMRQDEDSGILQNATRLRLLQNDLILNSFQFILNGYTDIKRLRESYEILDTLTNTYHTYGNEESIVIVRSNKRANQYNQQIRLKIFRREEELCVGDLLMVVRNNYFWPLNRDFEQAGFIANGDTIKILEISSYKELYGFRFASAKVQMIDYPDEDPFTTIIMLDTLTLETPSLDYERSTKLYEEVLKDYSEEKSNYRKYLRVKKNQYFNALQVKYSYAVTCHKAQGGQWKNVFLEQAYLPRGIDLDYLRWLYTAITRAKEKLYLIGFGNDYFK